MKTGSNSFFLLAAFVLAGVILALAAPVHSASLELAPRTLATGVATHASAKVPHG